MITTTIAPIAFDGVARPALGIPDAELLWIVEGKLRLLKSAEVTAKSGRGVRRHAHEQGLPTFERRRETAEQRRRREQLEMAKRLGLDGPSIAAQRMRGLAA